MSVVGKPGYKETDIGWISEEWMCTTLGEICSGKLQTGPFGSQLHADEYQDDGVPVLMPKDLVGYRANLSSAAKVAPSRATELLKHVLKSGDLLFSRRGDVTRFALIDELSEGALCGTGCLKATPTGGHVPAYLSHFLQLDAVRNWLEQNAVGQTMPNMNTGILASLPLATPPSKSEEEKIAAILTAVDDKLDVIARQIEATQTLKQGLMQTLFSRGVGTQDADGRRVPHTEFKDSELGEIPVGWEVLQLGNVFSFMSNGFVGTASPFYADPQSGIFYLQSNNIRENQIDYTKKIYVTQEFHLSQSKSILQDGDLLTVQSGHIGTTAVVRGDLVGKNCHALIISRPIKDKIFPEFAAQILNFHKNNGNMNGIFVGSTIKHINVKDFKRLKIAIPSIGEQLSIAKILSLSDEKLDLLQNRKSEYQALKRGLMQKLLTGEWRVKVETVMLEAEAEVTA